MDLKIFKPDTASMFYQIIGTCIIMLMVIGITQDNGLAGFIGLVGFLLEFLFWICLLIIDKKV